MSALPAGGHQGGHGLLAGRRVLVAGGGQQTYGQADPPLGIGRAVSRLAAREGAVVAVVDVDARAAAATVQAITDEGGTAHAFTGDWADEGDVSRILTSAAAVMGGLDGLAQRRHRRRPPLRRHHGGGLGPRDAGERAVGISRL